jgi:hypothetical protein
MMPIFSHPARLSLVAASILASCATHASCQIYHWDYIPNLPYTAQVIQISIERGANGTRVRQETKLVEARDSLGRTRIESFDSHHAGRPDVVNLYDPLHRQFIQLFPGKTLARVMTFPGTGPIPNHGLSLHAAKTIVEHLPGRTIRGIYAVGTRTTQIIPAGDGRSGDVVDVEETWVSPDRKIVVLWKDTSTDLESEETTAKVVRFTRNEPDSALFDIPADYTIEKAFPGSP